MANHKLGSDAKQEIRLSMTGLRGNVAKQMALNLETRYPATWQHIYKITADLRPKQKTRADKGKRTFRLEKGTDVWEAAKLVIAGKCDPDQALLIAKANGFTDLPSLAYFQMLLRENGIGKKQLANFRRAHRRFETEFPGEMIQIDVTALKVRWEDEKTRRILRIEGVDKNHPNPGENKVRVWQIMATDDFSRRKLLRYITATHITSRIMVEFCLELFMLWGVPKKIYSDNGSEFKGYFEQCEPLLNSILTNDGGFKHIRHEPGNAQATGKVENAHKWAEKADRYVGVAINKGLKVGIEELNAFADQACRYKNNIVHRETGQTPEMRWFSKKIVVRILPKEIVESALLTDKFSITLEPSLTISHKGEKYSVPSVNPYLDLSVQRTKIEVVVPLNIDLILLKLPGEDDFREIPKILAVADKAGEFKSIPESSPEKLVKQLKDDYKADNKEAKKKLKTTGEVYQVPFFNHEIELPQTNVTPFPHQERRISPDEVAAVVPVAPSMLSAKEIGYWEAVVRFGENFADVDEAKEFLLSMFPSEQGSFAESEIESAIKNRHNFRQQPTRIYAVK